jgi:hypothetical protein
LSQLLVKKPPTRGPTLEMPLQWSDLPESLGNDHDCLYHPLGICIRKNIWTCQGHVGLGWIFTASAGANI